MGLWFTVILSLLSSVAITKNNSHPGYFYGFPSNWNHTRHFLFTTVWQNKAITKIYSLYIASSTLKRIVSCDSFFGWMTSISFCNFPCKEYKLDQLVSIKTALRKIILLCKHDPNLTCWLVFKIVGLQL